MSPIPEKLLKPYDPAETEPRIQTLELGENPADSIYNPDNSNANSGTNADGNSASQKFSLILPPPNVTGVLHLGHGLMLTIQDILARKARMEGKKVLWIPGTDHAAIATQAVVEKEISKKEGKSRYDIGREPLLERINDFASTSRNTIVSQIKRMGASLDWSREAFTLDEVRSHAVRTMFKKMYDDGLIYRGFRIVNWDPKGQTTISDDEIVYEERKSKLYHFKYDKEFPFYIATSRPETKVGDTGVAIHPDDVDKINLLKNKGFEIGSDYNVKDFCGVELKLTFITDVLVDKEFGSGALGVTPAHSHVDWDIAKGNYLVKDKVIIGENAKMTDLAGSLLSGLKTIEAREKVVKWLKDNDLMHPDFPDGEDIVQRVATAERTGGVIEPMPKMQWWVAVNKSFKIRHSEIDGIKDGQQTTLKEIMHKSVSNGQINILPNHFDKTYFHWIDNLNDWCISRQIWYGHRIPVFYDIENEDNSLAFINFGNKGLLDLTPEIKEYLNNLNNETILYSEHENKLIGCNFWMAKRLVDAKFTTYKQIQSARINLNTRLIEQKNNNIKVLIDIENEFLEGSWLQDEDTLDTWFSSALWTFSTLGWPDKTGPGSDLTLYHPTDILVTGHEILFFWVARMILMTGYGLGTIPFKSVYITGMVRDSKGQKMSKSLGNGGDPVEISNKYGADALRMFYAMSTTPGTDTRIYEDKIKGYKHFGNKLWNITRFILSAIAENPHTSNTSDPEFKFDPNFMNSSSITDQDKAVYKEWRTHFTNISENLSEPSYKIHLAAEELYHYIWHTFADQILEESKPILKPEFSKSIVGDTESEADKVIDADLQDPEDKADIKAAAISRAQTLLHILREILLTTHPFMPHITQEIWSLLPADMRDPQASDTTESKNQVDHDMIAIERWPTQSHHS